MMINSLQPPFNGAGSSGFHGRRCGCDFNLVRTKSTVVVLIRAATTTTVTASVTGGGDDGGRAGGDYKRVPMDTAGAYRLVDEKSGEKYIVWGGADDDFSDSVATPSKDVLAWTPAAVTPSRVRSEAKRIPRDGVKANQGNVDVSSDLPTTRGGGSGSDRLGRNFGRLKSDSVRRVLARKTPTIRRKDVGVDEYDDDVIVKKTTRGYREISATRKDDVRVDGYDSNMIVKNTTKAHREFSSARKYNVGVGGYDDNVIAKKTAKGYREFSSPMRKDMNGYGGNSGVKKSAISYERTSSPIWRKGVSEYDDNVIIKKTAGNWESNELKAEVEYTRKKVRRKDAARVQDTVSETAEFEELKDPEPYQEKAPEYENKVTEVDTPPPKKPSAYLTKWGDVDGESVGNFRTEAHGSMQRLRKTSNDNGFFSRKSFKELGCNDYMIDSLRSLQFLRPSQIQAMAFPPVVQRKSCIITDQSGSGKTLAYLLPVIQRLREEELQGLSKSISQSPRVVILVPTAELATQVLSNCRAISKSGVPFRSMVVTGGFRQKTQLESLQQELDVLIATPGRFLYLVNEGFLQLKNLRCVVLDEVDLLYRDEDFNSALQRLMNFSPLTTQYLFVTATLPIDAYNKLVESFPDCEMVMGPSMHRVSSGLEEVLVDCSGDYNDEKNPETAFANKKSALLQIIEGNSVSKTILFCNKIETCRKVENILTRSDRKGAHMRVLTFHAALNQESRLANMKEFLNPRSEKDSQFFVCTDRASRGIDFAGVDHVILFDFPRDPSEYVRRVGRTARGAGGKGTAYVFVVGKQVSLARRIMERNQKGQPLHDVPYV